MFSTEVWLTPIILMPGVALLIVSTSARIGQIHSELHWLLDHPNRRAAELARHLLKRSALFRDALVALYASVAMFGLGSLLGGVVNLWRPESLWVVGGLTILGIGCVVYAAVQLLRESLMSIRVIREQSDELEQEEVEQSASSQ